MAYTTPKTWTAAVLTSAEMNEQVSDNIAFLKTHIALETPVSCQISGGILAKGDSSYLLVDGEGSADDELETITGGTIGDVLLVKADAIALTIKSGIGNIYTVEDIILDSDGSHVILIYDGTDWRLIGGNGGFRVKTYLWNNFIYPAPGTDWTPELKGAGLAQSLSSKKVWLTGNLNAMDFIASYTLRGDAILADALTLDAKIVKINQADPITTTDITGGRITQVTGDGNISSEATLTSPEYVQAGHQYAIEIQGTTGTGDSIIIMGAEVVVWELM